ncbi:FixH family protein [Thalassomonas haliotis]|uniref:FixH family protein n=1 Tax=Thalassomonas haliotis TaxID=485448 RepID=A0ABY7VKC0_9GAMM|nr:FixH family protein [Thalassomonas haliotis]WDE14192.1 FixH family protein [Thalassomonas haliotis]
MLLSRLLLILLLLTAKAVQAKSPDTAIENPLVAKAVTQLDQARQWQKQANERILHANTIRKQLKQRRARAAKSSRSASALPDNDKNTDKEEFEQEIQELLGQLTQAQQQGAELRRKSQLLKQQAKMDFEQALLHIWPQWLHNREALILEDNLNASLAHNTQIRSVHKNMLAFAGNSSKRVQRPDMSLQVPALGKQNAPADLNTSSFQFSRHEQYFAHIEVHPGGAGKANYSGMAEKEQGAGQTVLSEPASVPLNEIHQWRLMISDVRGNPVKDVDIEVQGHMPGHVHGLPTKPAVVEEIDAGIYLVDGLKFQMKGWWVMKFILRQEGADSSQFADDFFTFNLVL